MRPTNGLSQAQVQDGTSVSPWPAEADTSGSTIGMEPAPGRTALAPEAGAPLGSLARYPSHAIWGMDHDQASLRHCAAAFRLASSCSRGAGSPVHSRPCRCLSAYRAGPRYATGTRQCRGAAKALRRAAGKGITHLRAGGCTSTSSESHCAGLDASGSSRQSPFPKRGRWVALVAA